MRKAIAVRTENPESVVPQPSDDLIDARDTKGAHGRDDDREDWDHAKEDTRRGV